MLPGWDVLLKRSFVGGVWCVRISGVTKKLSRSTRNVTFAVGSYSVFRTMFSNQKVAYLERDRVTELKLLSLLSAPI